jgi:hypothetical protein
MPSKSAIRFAGFASPAGNELIDKLCETYGVAKSSLLEVIVLGAEACNVSLFDVITKGKERQKEVRPDGRRTRADVMRRLALIPADRLETMLAQAETASK